MQKTISIFNPMQNASKTTTAYLLANALAAHGKTCLIDADAVNDRKRAGSYYHMRSRLPKPFSCHTSQTWEALDEKTKQSFGYVVVDTQKNPANGLVEIVGTSSDLIIIPTPPTDGAWSEGVKPGVDAIREKNASAVMAILISNQAGADTETIESRADGADLPIIPNEIPQLDIDDCIGRGWLPQYANASQRRWTQIESVFSGLAQIVVEDML